MAFDIFLKIDGISGGSADDQHRDWIEIHSFSWGLSQSGTDGGGAGGGAGRATAQDAQFVSTAGIASPKLFGACASGRHFREALLSLVRAGADRREFYTWRLAEVLISSYRTAGDAGSDEVPADQFTLDFRRIEFSFLPQNPDGSAGDPVQESWEFAAGQS